MTKIEWTEATWNPIVGCSIVSPGCTNCYAMRMASRIEAINHAATTPTHYHDTTQRSKAGPVWTGKVALAPDRVFTEPLRRRKPTTYFVNSMGDLFHESVPDGWIMTVLDIMFRTPQHTYQVLTKRPARMREFMRRWADLSGEDFDPKLARGPDETRRAHPSGRGQLFASYLDTLLAMSGGSVPDGAAWPTFDWAGGMIGWPAFPANVWLGVSAERQQEADARIPDLLATPAAVRFVSAEPLLGPVDFTAPVYHDAVGISHRGYLRNKAETDDYQFHSPKLDWIIAGGESGPGARPMHPDWVRSIRDQCTAAGVPFFFKQWGEWAPGTHVDPDQDRLQTAHLDDWDTPRWHFGTETRAGAEGGHIDDEPDLYRVGKRRAGRLLDGHTWDEMPA